MRLREGEQETARLGLLAPQSGFEVLGGEARQVL